MADREEPTFFHYHDAAGRDVVVNDFNEIPEQFRAKAEVFDARPGPSTKSIINQTIPNMIGPVHVPSAALGFSISMFLVLLWWLRTQSRWATRIVFGVVGAVVVAGLYFGYVMRSAGLTDGYFGTPAQAIDKAREARDKANATAAAQARALQQIENAEKR